MPSISPHRLLSKTVPIGTRTIAVLRGGGRGWVLSTVAFGWFLGLGTRLAVPALVPYVRDAFQIGLGTAGLLLSVLWIAYALFQFPGGVVADRIGERNVLVASTALTTIGLAVCAVSRSTLSLFVGIVLVGTATGLYSAPRFTTLSDIYPDRAATAIGVSSAAGNVGTVVLPLTAGVLAVTISWRTGFAGVVPLFALAAVGLWLTVPVRTSSAESAMSELSRETIGQLATDIRNPRTIVFSLAMFLMSVIYQGFTSFYPSYLTTVKSLPEANAALLYSVFFAVGIIVQPISGAAADSIGSRRTMAMITALTAVALVAVTTVNGFWSLLLVSMLLGVQLGFWPIAQAGMIDSLPTRVQGSGFGLISTFYLLLAAGSPALVGALAGRDRFDETFVLLAGCAVVTVALSFILSSRNSA